MFLIKNRNAYSKKSKYPRQQRRTQVHDNCQQRDSQSRRKIPVEFFHLFCRDRVGENRRECNAHERVIECDTGKYIRVQKSTKHHGHSYAAKQTCPFWKFSSSLFQQQPRGKSNCSANRNRKKDHDRDHVHWNRSAGNCPHNQRVYREKNGNSYTKNTADVPQSQYPAKNQETRKPLIYKGFGFLNLSKNERDLFPLIFRILLWLIYALSIIRNSNFEPDFLLIIPFIKIFVAGKCCRIAGGMVPGGCAVNR